MRRIFVLALAVIALVRMMAPGAYAQAPAAPAPTFKITGFIDTITSASHNPRDVNSTPATGDLAGVNLVTTGSPNVKSNFPSAQIEEEVTGGSTGGTGATAFVRGDDFAIITSLEVTPIKGLDLRPTYAVLWAPGATHGIARVGVGGNPVQGGTPTFVAKPVGTGGGATPA